MDVANLVVEIDSRSVKPAVADLDKLTDAAGRTAPAIDAVGQSSKTATPAIVGLGGGVDKLGPALVTVTTAAATAGTGISKIGPAVDAAGAAIDKMGSSSDGAAKKIAPLGPAVEAVGKRALGARDDMGRFGKSTDDAAKSADGLGRSAKGASPAVEQLGGAAGRAGKETAEAGKNLSGVGRFLDENKYKIQNAAFQFGDLGVQVAAGTGFLRAFSQQAPQFLGIFGPGGAIAGAIVGIGAALGTTLIPMLFDAGDGMTDAGGKTATFSGQLDALTGSADAAAAKLNELNSAQLKVISSQSETAAAKAGESKTFYDRALAALASGMSGGEGSIAPPAPETPASGPVFAPGTPEAAFKQAQAAAQSLHPPQTDQDIRDYQKQLAQERKQARESLPKFDPLAGQRKATSLYPEGAGDADAMTKELNARNKAEFDRKAAEAKAAASKRASEAKAAAEHAKTIAKSLEDMTVAANDNAEAMTKQGDVVRNSATNSIAQDAAQKQMRLVQDQTRIETTLRRFRGDASAEQIQQARAALQAEAAAKRSAEDDLALKKEQTQWETQLANAKRNRANADQDKLRDLQGQTAAMMLDQQRTKVEENREVFKAYGQVAFDALNQIALGGEKANEALSNLLKAWANMAFQMASQRILQAAATALFPQATGAAPAGFGQVVAGAAISAGAGAARGGGGGGGAIGGGDIYAHQASGGPSEPGKTYMVGEHGRERFTPLVKGRVEPVGKSANQNLNISTTNNISLSGSATSADADMMAKAIDKKMNETIDARLTKHARSGGAFAA